MPSFHCYIKQKQKERKEYVKLHRLDFWAFVWHWYRKETFLILTFPVLKKTKLLAFFLLLFLFLINVDGNQCRRPCLSVNVVVLFCYFTLETFCIQWKKIEEEEADEHTEQQKNSERYLEIDKNNTLFVTEKKPISWLSNLDDLEERIGDNCIERLLSRTKGISSFFFLLLFVFKFRSCCFVWLIRTKEQEKRKWLN